LKDDGITKDLSNGYFFYLIVSNLIIIPYGFISQIKWPVVGMFFLIVSGLVFLITIIFKVLDFKKNSFKLQLKHIIKKKKQLLLCCLKDKTNTLLYLSFVIFLINLFLPLVIFPLPLRHDPKHHFIIVKLLFQQSKTIPNWNGVVAINSPVLYNLGFHISTSLFLAPIFLFSQNFLFNNLALFVNLNFKLVFIFAIFEIQAFLKTNLNSSYFRNSKKLKEYALISLFGLNPAFIWIAKWGGMAWISGIYFFFYTIRHLPNKVKNNQQSKLVPFSKLSKHFILFLSLVFTFWFHLMIGAQLFIFIIVWWFLNSEDKKQLWKRTFTLFILYLFVRFFSALILTFFSFSLSNFLLSEIKPTSQPFTLEFYLSDLYVSFFLGIYGLFVYNKMKKTKNHNLLHETKNIDILFYFTSFNVSLVALYIFVPELIDILLSFPGSSSVFKMRRIISFITIPIIIFSSLGLNQMYHNLKKYYKLLPNILLLTFVLICISGTTYQMYNDSSRAYNQYTLDSFNWIATHLPENSLFLNDFQGQWIPAFGNYRITYSMTPTVPDLPIKTMGTFLKLYSLRFSDREVIENFLKHDNIFGEQIDYIYLTNDIPRQMVNIVGPRNSTVVAFNEEFSLGIFAFIPNLSLIYNNSVVVIYKVVYL